MIKKTRVIPLLLLMAACNPEPKAMIDHIEGYWEIENVTLETGEQKEYSFNNTIDVIEMNDSLYGIRKKLMPKFDGTFSTSESEEQFQLKIENDSLNVYYQTPFNSWKETILFADEEQMRVVNANKVQYLYKRYEPIKLD